MKKQLSIHYFQHEPLEGPGCIKDWTEKENHLLSCTRFYQDEVPPDLSEIDWLVIMGGPMGIYDEPLYPWLAREKQYIRKAIEANKMIMGICLGAQLLADALGARVKPARNKEIGWFPVRKTEAGKTSVLLDDMPGQLTVFHWHGDQFDIPEGCLHLAESEACPNQLFQFGDRILALQFHFEVTAASIREMLRDAGDELNEAGPFIQPESAILNGLHYCDQNNRIMFSLLDKLSLLPV